jgi:putative flippase GtrA
MPRTDRLNSRHPFLKEIAGKYKRVIKFILVGVLNTAFGYSIFALLLKLGLHYAVATLAGTVVGVLFNFFTTGKLVFNSLSKKHLMRFISVYIFLYFLNILSLKILIMLGLSAYLAGLVLIPVMAFLSYFLQSRFTFKEST